MKHALKIQAGYQAKQLILREGFDQKQVSMMLGAAGGPKWFVISRLDEYLCGEFFRDRKEKLHLLGSSIGAWRLACYARQDGVSAIQKLRDLYFHYGGEQLARIRGRRRINYLSELNRQLLVELMGPGLSGVDEVLHNRVMKLSFISTACKGLLRKESKWTLVLGLLGAFSANMIDRKQLRHFYERSLFHTDIQSPAIGLDDFPTEEIPLHPNNMLDAMLSTVSIPLSTLGLEAIAGSNSRRVYRDGGLIDYHFDLALPVDKGLIFYPHFYAHAFPGWFDNLGKRRRASAINYSKVLMLSPSRELMDRLPQKRLTDRGDFERLTYRQRLKYWQQVVDMGSYMADAFHELLEKEEMAAHITDFK